MDAIEFDVTKTLDKFNKLSKDMPFLISKSANDVAFEKGKKDASKDIHKNMEVRNRQFSSERSIRIKKSTKNNLTVELFHFKEQMGLQQFGGVETPKGNKLAVPIRRNLSKYAGIPNSKKIPKSLSINTLMEKAPRKRGQTVYATKGIKPFITNRGVMIRTESGLRLIYSFMDKAKHKKILFKMQKVIERTYDINFERYFERNYLRALKG